MSTHLNALRTSVARLRDIAGPLQDTQIIRPAYPAEWTIADVMSHLGSGAVITRRRLGDIVEGSATPDEFAPNVWDEWNAKPPRAQVDDALAADAALLVSLEGVSDEQRAAFLFAMGPMTFDFDGFIALRLNEHAFHTWDIEVMFHPTATMPVEISSFVVDNLGLVARYTGKAPADPITLNVRTTDPERTFILRLAEGGAVLERSSRQEVADLELPAEAFARLVYGRLDAARTPDVVGDLATLKQLRAAFPGP